MNPLKASLLPNPLLVKLRALRLWHWRRCLVYRDQSRGISIPALKEISDDLADFHLKQVQLLNEFFPVDDTAEGDDK